MNVIKKYYNVKIVPQDTTKISSGVIRETGKDTFAVKLSIPVFLNEDEDVEIFIHKENCVITFSSKVKKVKDDLINFSIPTTLNYIQKREYPRIDVNLPLKYNIYNKTYKTSTTNIGGGGMQFISGNAMELSKLIQTELTLFKGKKINSLFEILRVVEKNAKFLVSGRFNDLSCEDKTKLIQLCIKKKMEMQFKKPTQLVQQGDG